MSLVLRHSAKRADSKEGQSNKLNTVLSAHEPPPSTLPRAYRRRSQCRSASSVTTGERERSERPSFPFLTQLPTHQAFAPSRPPGAHPTFFRLGLLPWSYPAGFVVPALVRCRKPTAFQLEIFRRANRVGRSQGLGSK
jgi:hypothetical protein